MPPPVNGPPIRKEEVHTKTTNVENYKTVAKVSSTTITKVQEVQRTLPNNASSRCSQTMPVQKFL